MLAPASHYAAGSGSIQKGRIMKEWTEPSFEELAMNAEIGAYQPEPDDREVPPVVESASSLEQHDKRPC
jgi:hypothetical protein